ncbi:hypothetical protein GOP47_0017197 [Adiantum capillus-veneris]|uniref:Myb-like domain-containing protein n=1 Tax=Adiantum capillus-veneris TaxID=13818 RepID=A0A9D4UIC3_ADICA|nr:hypothetical protein GOP47_0016781 [Adiantum capillus-veneris]KAI5068852.1 hypothetical protein GOP47_0017197 [Adiantum capillus-veneris]
MEDMPGDQVLLLQPPTKKMKIARVRYPNWEKKDTLALVKSYQRQVVEFANAASKGRTTENEQKWDRIASLCGKEGVSRDAEQCRKRWQDLLRGYKRIKEWEGTTEVPSFWLMSSSSRKDKKLPGNFEKEIFDRMDVFMGSKAIVQLHSSKVSSNGLDNTPSGGVDGRSSALATNTEPQGDPSSQEASWSLSKERIFPSRDDRKPIQSFQADSGADNRDPIAEAVEHATRAAQEQCSAQMTEVLAQVLLKMADAIKMVAENIRKPSI